jgi:hypothetical protein
MAIFEIFPYFYHPVASPLSCFSSSSAMINSCTSSPPFRTLRRTIAFLVVALVLVVGVSHALPLSSSSKSPKEKRQVVCTASSWYDVVAFFLLNFVAHAATIRHYPGDNTPTQVFWTICALLLPFSGVWRACLSIADARPFEKDPLGRAKYAGALCMSTARVLPIVRPGELVELRGCRIKGKVPPTVESERFVDCIVRILASDANFNSKEVHPTTNKIHGCCWTGPGGHSLHMQVVPPEFMVVSVCPTRTCKVELSCSNSMAKCATAVVQVGFACYTVYRTRSNQVEDYGYAAFGLTVIPYAIMSLLNLTANLLTPEYPTLFMVHSDYMDVANQLTNQTRYDGTVGTIVPRNAPLGNGEYDTITAKILPYPSIGVMRAAIEIPEGYVDDSGEEGLEVEISAFGRHEKIPIVRTTQRIRNLAAIALGTIALATPYAFIAVFTRFQTGSISTPLQRGFVMSWLVTGQVFGAVMGIVGHSDSAFMMNKVLFGGIDSATPYLLPCFLLIVSAAVGGFVVVGLMIKQFGSCTLI